MNTIYLRKQQRLFIATEIPSCLLQPGFLRLRVKEFVKEPIVITRPVRLEHLRDGIALAVGPDAEISAECVDVLEKGRGRGKRESVKASIGMNGVNNLDDLAELGARGGM